MIGDRFAVTNTCAQQPSAWRPVFFRRRAAALTLFIPIWVASLSLSLVQP
jgi:hypothetical protein